MGQSAVGKTCLVRRLVKNTFSDHYQPTFGANFSSINIDVDGVCRKLQVFLEIICLQIWDVSGMFSYRCTNSIYYANANIIVLVYDTTSRDSFNTLKDML